MILEQAFYMPMAMTSVISFLSLPVLAAAPLSAPPAPTPAPPVPAQNVRTESAMANIGYLTARQLVDRCSDNSPANSSYCFAYIAAVTDTVRAYEIWLNSREFCLPSNIAQSEIRRAFMTYLSAYSDQASGQAASVVVNALKTTYPCD